MGKVTPTGYETTSKEEIREQVRALWSDAFGPNLSLETATPQGQIIEIMTDALVQIDQSRQDDFNARDLYRAVGRQLDIIGREMGAPRKEAVPTQLVVKITGQSNYTLAAGTEYNMIDDVSRTFQNQSAIVISSDSVQAALTALNGSVYGDIQIGQKLQTVSYYQQVSDIVVLSVVPGQPAEDDNTYRTRLVHLKDSGIDDISHLRLRLTEINNVLDAFVKQNNSLETDEYGIPPHCIEIIVLGGDESDIGQVCLKDVTLGTPTYLNPVGGETITVEDLFGYPQKYNITRPTQVNFSVEATYSAKRGNVVSKADVQSMIDRVVAYLNTRYIGRTVYKSDIAYFLLETIQNKLELKSLVIKADGVEITDSYIMTIRQYAVAGTITVEEAA